MPPPSSTSDRRRRRVQAAPLRAAILGVGTATQTVPSQHPMQLSELQWVPVPPADRRAHRPRRQATAAARSWVTPPVPVTPPVATTPPLPAAPPVP